MGKNACQSYGEQHAGQHFEAAILTVAQAIRPTLEDANFVVEPFDEAELDFVLG